MGKLLKHIGALCVVVTMALVSCSRDEAVVIPRSQLAKIYAEMLVTDQWILSTPKVRTIADTSLVYAPILEKYGYDTDDYLKTIEVYMNDPERFARIFRSSGEILEGQLNELKEKKLQQEIQSRLDAERLRLFELYQTDFMPQEYFPYLYDEPYVHYYDSLAFEADSTTKVYRLKPIETADTLYDRIRMVFPADTLAQCDTLSHKDTVPVLPEKKILQSPKKLLPPLKNKPERPERLNGKKMPERIKK